MYLKIVKSFDISKNCAVCGADNPFSMKTRFFALENGWAAGIANPKDFHQSYPGRVHGGLIAALIDEAVGRAVNVSEPDTWGVTGELEIKYKKPVPYGKPLYVVSRPVSNNRRIFEGEGMVFSEDGVVYAVGYAKYMKLTPAEIHDGGDLGMLPPPPDAPKGMEVPDFPKTRRQKCL